MSSTFFEHQVIVWYMVIFLIVSTTIFVCSAIYKSISERRETMTKSYSRGHEIYYDGKDWRYVDNDEIQNEMRPCKRCGRVPTKEGYDACLGHIEGAVSACCGHGVEEPYAVKEGAK